MAFRLADSGALTIVHRAAAPLRRKVLEAMRSSIVEGRLPPGSRLVERELIDMLGVSRTVVREALRQLESEGLIDVVPNKGAVVRALTLAEAKDLYAIRAVLEGLAARLFVENASAEEIQNLEHALAATIDAYAADEPGTISEAKSSFYDVLFRGAKSPTLGAMIDALSARVQRWRAVGLSHAKRSTERSQESVNDLSAIHAAIRAGDGELAERLARQEVMNAAAEIARLLEASGPAPPSPGPESAGTAS